MLVLLLLCGRAKSSQTSQEPCSKLQLVAASNQFTQANPNQPMGSWDSICLAASAAGQLCYNRPLYALDKTASELHAPVQDTSRARKGWSHCSHRGHAIASDTGCAGPSPQCRCGLLDGCHTCHVERPAQHAAPHCLIDNGSGGFRCSLLDTNRLHRSCNSKKQRKRSGLRRIKQFGKCSRYTTSLLTCPC